MKKIHIFNSFKTEHGGSEQEALHLAKMLSKHVEVKLWASTSRACPELMGKYDIQKISFLTKGGCPKGGTYIFVGCHWRNKLWPYLIPRPERLINIYNTFHPKHVKLTSHHPKLLRWPDVEYVVVSDYQKNAENIDAKVFPSPIDISKFFQCKKRDLDDKKMIVVGRMSRDDPGKHNISDIDIYKFLANSNVKIILQGASCLKSELSNTENIEILNTGTLEANDFYHYLDIFYYRTGEHIETFGRVVFEAMAAGLPIVVERKGGYVDWIEHGKNGFLFDTTEEAKKLLEMLVNDQHLRDFIGRNAVKTTQYMYGEENMLKQLEFYTR
ncbi:MAG: glycosyltransferase family 4 protein [Halomonas sp.]|nr:glycosyltransferase family 4 protein [Halomonas sp.]MBR2513553.1 glycosyltransferase family 4 protein [Halomonas sp.]